MPELSKRVSQFTDSVIRRMTRISDAHGAINLSQGFPDFDPPREILDALAKASYAGPHQYSITFGAPHFRRALADKQSISLPEDMLEKNLDIVDHSAKDATTSMQRDIKAGHESEVDGLVYAVVRRGKELGVPLPRYEEIADILHKKLD